MNQRHAAWCSLAVIFLIGCSGGDPPPNQTINPVLPDTNDRDDTPAVPANDSSSSDSSTPKHEPSDTTPIPAPPALTAQQKALRELLSKLAHHDGISWQIDPNAKQQLATAARDAIDDVVAAMSDESSDVRRGAVFFLLERIDPNHAEMMKGFQSTLADDDKNIRHLSLTAFKRMPDDAIGAAAKQLLALLERKDESSSNRASVARLLAKLDSHAAEILPAISKYARSDADDAVRKACLLAVARLADPADALPLFRHTLTSETDASLRRVAADRLRLLGVEAAPAAKDLASALDDSDEQVRTAARNALAEIGPPAVEPLIAQLTAKNPRTRALAVFCLGKLGSAAKPAVLEISKRFEDEDEEVRELAKRVVEVIRAAP